MSKKTKNYLLLLAFVVCFTIFVFDDVTQSTAFVSTNFETESLNLSDPLLPEAKLFFEFVEQVFNFIFRG